MKRPIKPIDVSPLKTYPLETRKSKVARADFGRPWQPGGKLSDFLSTLPNMLVAADFKKVVSAIARSHEAQKHVILAMGAHVVKVGLNPIVTDLMHFRRPFSGVLQLIELNIDNRIRFIFRRSGGSADRAGFAVRFLDWFIS